MSPQSEQYGAGRASSGSHPRVWWTRSQLDHSGNFIGSERERLMADAIRAAEQIGSDGMVRALPETSISYERALEMLGMGDE